jgi:Secretion system C-terminal sorting domain/SprB repeat/Right handed beta helix region
LYSGSCSTLNLLYSQSATHPSQKNLTINAIGLSTTQVYFIKVYNSSISTNYSICLQNRKSTLSACGNLLSNGDFESNTGSPNCSSPPASFTAGLASGWGVINSPDYFIVGVSLSGCLSFIPSPHTGSAHIGFAVGGSTDPSYKEYITNSVSVTSGTTYQIVFYYKTADTGPIAPNVGVYASDSPISSPPATALPKTELPDINGYTKVTSYYTATGSTLFFAIGSYTSATTSDLQYYYVDDASVIESPNINITGQMIVCSSSTTNVTLTANNASSFVWSCSPSFSNFSTTGSSAFINSPYPPVTSYTTYTITLTSTTPSGCTSVITFPFVITPSPSPAPVVTGVHTFCSGSSIILHAGVSGPFVSSLQWFFNGVAIAGATGAAYSNYTATLPGTYTVQIGFSGGGCTSTSPPFVVTVLPSPLVSCISNIPASCIGNSDGQATASVVSGIAPYTYSWSNGTIHTTSLTTDNNDGIAGGTYTVTVTDANGCTGTASVTVANLPLFAAPVISGDGTICSFTSITNYTITNYSSIYTYSLPVITPVGAGTASAISATGTFTVLWNASAVLSGATISVVATASTGCTNKGQKIFYPCCLGPHGTTNVVNGFSSTLPNPFVGGTLVINGTFTIDNNFTIKGTDVVMAAGAKIIIPSAGSPKTLTLTNNGGNSTYVHAGACGIMWNSIYIQLGQTLVVNNNTRIEDADSAVVSIDGGKYTIRNSELNKNYKHIVVMPYTGTFTGTIEQSNLFCRKYPTLTNATLLMPYASGTRTNIGIDIKDVQAIQVGSTTSATVRNNFRNSDIGIRSLRSNLTVFNNVFINIDNPASLVCKSCACQIGTAICATGGKTPSHSLIVAGASPITNSFVNCVTGIKASTNLDVFVQGNSFFNLTGTGVYITQCSLRLLDVSNNTMNGVISGIDMYENPNALSMNIANNNINLAGGGFGSAISNYAIVVQNVMLNPNNAIINNNIIDRAKTGIWLINSDATDVADNTITYPNSMVVTGAKLIGIRLEGSDNSKVQGNTISKTGAVPTVATELLLRGISVENTQNSGIGKNTLLKMGQGIRMLNACNNAVIGCNTLNRCYVGLRFDVANVGDQLSGGVAQANTFPAMAGPFKMDGTITPAIKFWYAGGGFYVPFPISLSLISFGFLSGYPAITSDPEDICTSFHAPIFPSVTRDQKFGKIVRNSITYPISPMEFRFSDKEMAYRELKKDTTFMALGAPDDSVYQNFYHATQTTPIGKFAQVNALINSDNIATATAINGAVVSTTTIESNRKLVNEIYLRTFASGNYNLDVTDEDVLLSIAILNPLTDGDAVYSARSMLRIDPTDNSTVRTMAEETPEEIIAQETKMIGKLYPNPNNGIMQLEYTITEDQNAILVIYDVTGRKLSSYTMNSNNNKLQIDESKLSSGIYFYQIILNNQLIQADKFIIAK